MSPYIYYGSDRLHLVEESYHVVGQDGMRFNGSVLSPTNNSVPNDVANALYMQSDHLPVVMDLAIDAHVGVVERTADFFVNVINPVREKLQVELQSNRSESYTITLYSVDGRLLASYHENLEEGTHRLSYPFPYGKGAYLMIFQDKNGQKAVKKLVTF